MNFQCSKTYISVYFFQFKEEQGERRREEEWEEGAEEKEEGRMRERGEIMAQIYICTTFLNEFKVKNQSLGRPLRKNSSLTSIN